MCAGPADGAKLALWALWRAGYRIVNFVHDEVLVEVPLGTDLFQATQHVRQLMIDAMRQVTPNVRIDADVVATTRWSKAAKPVYDPEGRLLPWVPPTAQSDSSVAA